MATDRDSFFSDKEFFITCRNAALQGPSKQAPEIELDHEAFEADAEGADEAVAAGAAASEAWTANVAKRLWRMCNSLRSELMHERMISLLVEWCETPRAESSCVAYKDTCVEFTADSEDRILRHVQKSPANNCYLYIPHNLLDPVMEANCTKLCKFYSRTFWANKDVFLCCQAALALAKRGINVDRCFIGESPGGVGQSLYSLHLATMLGNNHGFFDPNVWYNEDELRKQVETFARCIVITGQEAPESAKKLHLDLFKKTMSGDGIAGRKPYGYTTKMFQLIGWKRLEVNRMLRFAGVTPSNFNSVFRRGFFWQAKARFHPPHVIATLHADHELDGHFEADPTLKQFLSSAPSAAAGLRIQHAFESNTGRQECMDLIENYVSGGDESLSEDKMRVACGLPVRDRSKDTGRAGAVMLHIPDSEEDKDCEEKQWLQLRSILVNDLLDRCVTSVTAYEFQQMKLESNQVPNLARQDLWKGLLDRKFVVKGCSRNTRGRASVQVQPILVPEKDFFEVVKARKADETQLFVESVNLKAARAMAEKNRGLHNLDTLLAFFQAKVKAFKPKRGRPTGQAEKEILKFEKFAQKVEEQKSACKALTKLGLHDAVAPSPERRRLKKTEPRVERHVTYRYAGERDTRDRRYANGFAAQTCSRRLQQYLFPHTADLDIQTCCLAILVQLYEKIAPQPPLPDGVLNFLLRCVSNRKDVCEKELKVSASDGKQIINSVLHGGALPAEVKERESGKALLRLSIYMRWLACSIFSEEFNDLCQDTSKRNPDATAFFYLWATVEDWIVELWVSKLQTLSPEHLSLHFDGVRLAVDMTAWANNQQQFLEDCERHIHKETGFKVAIVEKKHLSLLQLVQSSARQTDIVENVPGSLLQPSNSICCACWHLLSDRQEEVTNSLSTSSQTNSYAEDRGLRSYKQYAEMLALKLLPSHGLPPCQDGKYLLHLESDCFPSCVAVSVDQTCNDVTIFAGKQRHCLSYQELLNLYLLCTDRLLVAHFALGMAEADAKDAAHQLLDLEAGSSDSEDLLPEAQYLVDDEGAVYFADAILTSLEEERNSFQQTVKDSQGRRCEGLRACALCPFRAFTERRKLLKHLQSHHSAKNQFVCSGTKQIKIILSLHDADCARRNMQFSYRQRSAEYIRAQVRPPLSHKRNQVDRHVRLLLTAAGPMYCNETALGVTVFARRVRNVYYDKTFAEMLYRELVLHHANVKSVWGRLHLRCIEAGNELSNLLPTHTQHWWPIVEDVFTSTAVRNLLASLQLTFEAASEYTCISIDATLKVAMCIKGQGNYRASAAVRNDACFGDDEALRRVLTVRGQTGAVLVIQLIKGEDANEIGLCLQRSLSTSSRLQVRYVMSDSPSVKLLKALQPVFPNLKGLALDPVHLAIVYEYAQWRKRTPGSKLLRQLLNKVVQHDPQRGMLSWGPLFDGEEWCPLTRQEDKWRGQILNWTQSKAYVQRVVDNLDPTLPVLTRVSFIEAVAAICVLHSKEVDRKVTGTSKPVRDVLWSACSPQRLEWLFNNQRVRHALSPLQRALLPSGTTSNEALHSEINSWTRSTHEVHRATLKLKLQIFSLGKQLVHHIATCYPPARQTSDNVLLARCLGANLWSDAEWQDSASMETWLQIINARHVSSQFLLR